MNRKLTVKGLKLYSALGLKTTTYKTTYLGLGVQD